MAKRSVVRPIRPDTDREEKVFIGRTPLISGIFLPNTDQVASSKSY